MRTNNTWLQTFQVTQFIFRQLSFNMETSNPLSSEKVREKASQICAEYLQVGIVIMVHWKNIYILGSLEMHFTVPIENSTNKWRSVKFSILCRIASRGETKRPWTRGCSAATVWRPECGTSASVSYPHGDGRLHDVGGAGVGARPPLRLPRREARGVHLRAQHELDRDDVRQVQRGDRQERGSHTLSWCSRQ